MFRERSQKKNIITLALIFVWIILLEYFCVLLVGASSIGAPNSIQKTEIQSSNNINTSSLVSSNESIKIEEPTQTTVESEVIDEYFDDAQPTIVYQVPNIDTTFKSYTYYTALSKRSIQWKLQEKAYTDENGLRKIEDYFLVAMGSYYSTRIGDCFRITTDTGATFKVMLCDSKANKHTDSKNMYTLENNCMVEFYVDKTNFNLLPKIRGTLSVFPQFDGSIIKVEPLGYYEWN